MGNFSDDLQTLLSGKKRITLQMLIDSFAEKSFALFFLLLMAISALPLPTGGITQIFELIVMLLALELIAGRQAVWLPHRWLNKPIPKSLQTTALPKFMKTIRRVEKHSRPRFSKLQNHHLTKRFIGVIVFIFTLFSFIAPPFSGLDTLPAMGVLFLSLALIFEDGALTVIGTVIGTTGILLVLLLGRAAISFI